MLLESPSSADTELCSDGYAGAETVVLDSSVGCCCCPFWDFVVPMVREALCAEMNFTAPYICNQGALLLLMTDTAVVQQLSGLSHGQLFSALGPSHEAMFFWFVGVGRSMEGTLRLFARHHGEQFVRAMTVGSVIRVYDLRRDVPSAKTARTIVYHSIPQLPHHIPLRFDWPEMVCDASGGLHMIDRDANRCRLLFGISPGQRICGHSTAVGMGIVQTVSGCKLQMYFQRDGADLCSTYSDGTRLVLEDL
jgi:hypothetical protein